jgi:hypothetical protein
MGIFAAGPPIAVVAPPTSDKDNPASPATGTAFFRLFRFEGFLVRAIPEFSML